MRVLPVLLLLATALAGCSDEAGAPDAHEGHDGMGMDPGIAPAEAPAWKLGDHWTYQDNLGSTYSLVVAEDEGGDWVLLSNDKQVARFDARFDISFVGKVRKADLAGAQGSTRIQFFDFPLHHGKSWSTDWDGQNRHVVAEAMPDGTYHIIAHVAGNEVGDQYASYHYDPAVGFFGALTFYDGNGTVAYEAELTDHGEDFRGTLYRFGEARELASVTSAGPGLSTGTFDTSGEPGDLFLHADLDCNGEPGAILYAVQPPQEDGSAAAAPPVPGVDGGVVLGNDDPCPEATDVQSALVEDPSAGTWRYDVANGSVGGGSLHIAATWMPREDIAR